MVSMDQIRDFWANKWKEAKEDSFSISIGNTGASATLTGFIDSEHFALAIGSILGYSTVEARTLWRIAPSIHPRVRNLYASSVKITPYAFQSSTKPPLPTKELAPVNLSTYIIPYLPIESLNMPFWTSTYKVLKVDIDYSEFVGVSFVSNTQANFVLNEEYKRYTLITFEPSLEVLQMDNMANLVFDTGPAMNNAFPTPVGITLPQAKLKIKWLWVPHGFISDVPIGKVPNCGRIQRKLGTVNRNEFISFRPGTLLFTGYTMEPIVTPFPDLTSNSIIMQLSWNIEFEFLHIDTTTPQPLLPAFFNNPSEHLPWRNYGHNLFPCRVDRQFYPASIREERQSRNLGKPLYQASDFSEMFFSIK